MFGIMKKFLFSRRLYGPPPPEALEPAGWNDLSRIDEERKRRQQRERAR